MAGLDEKLRDVYEEVLRRNPGEKEFHQAVHEVFDSLGAARKALAIWRHDYNNVRPHSALGGIPPAAARCTPANSARKRATSSGAKPSSSLWR